MTPVNFADRLHAAIDSKQSRVVVGLDPDFSKLPRSLRDAASRMQLPGLASELWAIREFCEKLIESTAPYAAAFKPQIAFFERYGAAGLEVLHRILEDHPQQIFIVDCKRGDIGSTSEAYARAYFSLPGEPAAPLGCDAVTHNPYLGHDTIEPYEKYLAVDKGMFLLAKTSNPSSVDFQDQTIDGQPLADLVARKVEQWGAPFRGSCGYSSLGLVVGATYPESAIRIRTLAPHAIILVPGLETQGGKLSDAHYFADMKGHGAVFNFSRAIIYAHAGEKFGTGESGEGFDRSSAAAAQHYRDELNQSLRVAEHA